MEDDNKAAEETTVEQSEAVAEAPQPAENAGGEQAEEFEKVIDEVDLDKFELDDLEDYQEAIKDLTLKKRKAYDQAKRERLEKEQLKRELDELRSNKTMADNDEIQALKAELAAKEQAYNDAMALAQAEKNKQADLMFDHAAELLEVNEPEYVKFKLQEHLKAQESLEGFSVKEWMSEFKAKSPGFFGKAQTVVEARAEMAAATTKHAAKEPATSGAPPAAPVSTSYEPQAPTGFVSPKKLANEWETYAKANGFIK